MPLCNLNKRIVIGLGSGRCGTKSLSFLLRAHGCDVTHECSERLVWPDQIDLACYKVIDARIWHLLQRSASVVGDVAFYYLPYVESIISICDELNVPVRFVCMRRDKLETIKSYILWVKSRNANHWVAHDGFQYSKSPWDKCYPSYHALSMADAIEVYLDDYYRQSTHLSEVYPNQFGVFEMNALNQLVGVRSIIDFIGGIEFRRAYVGIRKNSNYAHY